METDSQKCILITDSNTHFFVFIEQDQNPLARLPFKSEIPPKVLQKSDITVIKENHLLINTHNEIDPFTIFPDFTTAYDYGFISLISKSGGFGTYTPDKPEIKKEYKYWDILNTNDKKLIEEYFA